MVISGVFALQFAYSQNNDDSAFLAIGKANVRAVYFNSIGSQAPWINGRLNVPYNFAFENGTPYFGAPSFTKGTLVYNGIEYNDVNLVYDQMLDKLISYVEKGRMELLFDHVNGFTLQGHPFIAVSKDTIARMNRGYYEKLYQGRLVVLKKNLMEIKEDLVAGVGTLRSIITKPVYYIQKNNSYYHVTSKKTLLAALTDKKDDLQKFIKRNKLGWKKDTERLISETVAYYDQLTK